MIVQERDLTDIVNREAKTYAIYTAECRAIPNLIDGLKPVQRFVLYRALELSKSDKSKFHKLASVAGGVADVGYHHGEVNAQEAGALMANTWNNNFPLLDGQGNFGSRLVQKAAASRYVFCRVSENFRKVYKDTEVAPVHEDEEHVPPKFFLPVIPTVLLNGINGVATGYATKILPHSFESVVKCTMLALEGTLNEEPVVSYPEFKGYVNKVKDQQYTIEGTYSHVSRTRINITELTPRWDRATYVEEVLDPMENDGKISYEDNCSKNGFGFKVTLRKDFNLPVDAEAQHDKIMKEFKLIEKVTQNIVVVDELGKVRTFEKASDLIKHFVKVRLEYTEKRIDYMIKKTTEKFELAKAKALFIRSVIQGEIVISGKTKKQLSEEILKDYSPLYSEEVIPHLLALNIYHITSDEAKKLALAAKEAKDELDYWKNTTAIVEYHKDLENLV